VSLLPGTPLGVYEVVAPIVAEIPGRAAATNAPFTILVNWQSAAARGVRPVTVGGR
jgi:hypothetical protein